MKLGIAEPEVFRQALQSIARFVDRAHFDIMSDGVRIRTVDSHDFCYVDLFFKKPFFNGEFDGGHLGFGLDTSKLGRILPALSRAKKMWLEADGETLDIGADADSQLTYKIGWLDDDFDLPEPKRISYEMETRISAKEFTHLVNAASAISNELQFSVRNGLLTVSAAGGSYQFIGKPKNPQLNVYSDSSTHVSAYVLASYLRSLKTLIEKCSTVRIMFGKEKPIQFDLLYGDKAAFSFALSPKKLHPTKRHDRQGTSLPRLTASRFPDFLLYLSSTPRGETSKMLEIAGLETSGGDYSRLAIMLGMVSRNRGDLKITNRGNQFANLMKSSPDAARLYLHKSIVERVPAYSLMIGILKRRSMSVDDLFESVNMRMKKRGKPSIDRQDLSTMLGLSAWCGVVDRRMALYYFGKRKGGKSE